MWSYLWGVIKTHKAPYLDDAFRVLKTTYSYPNNRYKGIYVKWDLHSHICIKFITFYVHTYNVTLLIKKLINRLIIPIHEFFNLRGVGELERHYNKINNRVLISYRRYTWNQQRGVPQLKWRRTVCRSLLLFASQLI